MIGRWITFEGIGGSGKSTQVERVKCWLEAKRIPVVMTREPGGTEIGRVFRQIVKEPRTPKLTAFSELMLFEADRRETYKQVVQPAISQGTIILSDRGPDGSVAYQGFGRGEQIELIHQLTKLATEGNAPDITILIDIPIQVHLQRLIARLDEEKDQFDDEEIAFQERVRDGFLWCANNEPSRIKVVDGTCSEEEVTSEIINILKNAIILPE